MDISPQNMVVYGVVILAAVGLVLHYIRKSRLRKNAKRCPGECGCKKEILVNRP